MVRVEPPLRGEWRMLGSEGIDNDGDGRINEDTPGYLDMNRNYPFKWQPEYVQGGSGQFPLCARPTRAVADFVSSHPNICFNYAYHNSGGMILRGPGSKLSGLYSPKDIEVYDFLGEEGDFLEEHVFVDFEVGVVEHFVDALFDAFEVGLDDRVGELGEGVEVLGDGAALFVEVGEDGLAFFGAHVA